MSKRKWDVGVISGEYKLLIEDFGRNQHRNRLFKWKCLNCNAIHGPSHINHINRTFYPNCCMISRKHGEKTFGYKDISSKHMLSIYRSAVDRNLEFDVDAKFLWHLWLKQDGKCVYTNKPLSFKTVPRTASLDRINSKVGYVKNNVQWVDVKINRMKLDLSEQEFLELCSLVSSRKEIK